MNIYKIVENELNEKLGFYILPFNKSSFNNNILFFVNDDNNMYFNKNMLFDLFTKSTNKLLIYNYIQNEDNIWPLNFLKNCNYSYKPIIIDCITINTIDVKNVIYNYFYFIDFKKNGQWSIYTTNKYKDHVIYIKSHTNIENYLQRIFIKNINPKIKDILHENLIDYCFNNKNLFRKYFNILWENNSVYCEIEINKCINSLIDIKHIISEYQII